jgi:hypothetical protein
MEVLSVLLNTLACFECPRLWMQAPDVQALHQVDIVVTLGDFLWALAEMNP